MTSTFISGFMVYKNNNVKKIHYGHLNKNYALSTFWENEIFLLSIKITYKQPYMDKFAYVSIV